METQRPIGGLPMKGNTPEDVERMERQLNFLIGLVPREPAEKLINEVIDEIDKEIDAMDTKGIELIFPTGAEITNPETESFSPEARDLAFKKAETDNFIVLLVQGWANCLWELASSREEKGKLNQLNEMLIPIAPDGSTDNWLNFILEPTVSIIADKKDRVVEIYNAFATNLKSEIDKQEKKTLPLFEDCQTMLTIGRDERGYFLNVTEKS